jgi:hypothetical protein
VAERVADVAREYPERAFRPVSEEEGRRLRAEVVEEAWSESVVSPVEEWRESFTVEEVEERTALPWIAVVEEFLEWYEGYRGAAVKFGRGRPDTDEWETFSVPIENSFQPEYQTREFARLKALERELIGGERPTGGGCEGAYAEPYTAILTRSASSTGEGGEFRPVVDHDREVADAWNDGVKRALRYALEERLGLASDGWEYHKQGEPHPGGGEASGYGHDHAVIFADLGSVEADGDDLAEALRPVVDKHVEVCEGAGPEAHGADAVSVMDAEDFEQGAASYAASYLSIDDERDLLERSEEYIMWAASQWATATQKGVRSVGANAAIAADRCKQRCEHHEADQEVAHGEEIVKSARRGYEYECAACRSPWGVRQDYETLTAARLDDGDGDGDGGPGEEVRRAAAVAGPEPVGGEVTAAAGSTAEVVADGGVDRESVEEELRGRWPSARSAAVVGRSSEDLEVAEEYDTAGESVGTERPPQWRAVSVVQGGEEYPVKRLGGVEMRALTFREERGVSGGLRRCEETGEWETDCGADGHRIARDGEMEYCERCGVSVQSLVDVVGVPRSALRYVEGGGGEKGEDGAAERPPAEDLMWPGEVAGGREDGVAGEHDGLTGEERDALRRYAENHPSADVMGVVAGVLPSDPAAAEEFVKDVVST